MGSNAYFLDREARLYAYQIRVTLIHENLTLQTYPELVLINFVQSDAMEFRLINCFEKFTKKLSPISLGATIANHHCYLNQSSTVPMDEFLRLLKVRFQRLLKISPLVKPAFASSNLLLETQARTNFETSSGKRKNRDSQFTIDELILMRSPTDPFSLKAIGRPKLVRHFTFKGQKRYTSTLLV